MLVCGACWGSPACDDHIYFELYQISGKFGQAIQLPLAVAIFNHYVLSLDIPCLTECLSKRFDAARFRRTGVSKEKPDPKWFSGLLRLSEPAKGENHTAHDAASDTYPSNTHNDPDPRTRRCGRNRTLISYWFSV